MNDRIISFSVLPEEMDRIRREADRRGVPFSAMLKAILVERTDGFTNWENVPVYIRHNVRRDVPVQPQIVQLDTEEVRDYVEEEVPIQEDFGPSTVVPRTWVAKRK